MNCPSPYRRYELARYLQSEQSWQLLNGTSADQADKGFRCFHASFAPTEILHYLEVIAINLFSVLALVDKEAGFFLFSSGGDVDIIGGRERKCLASPVDLKEIESEFAAAAHMGANRQNAGGLVGWMRVDGPLGEDDIGFLGRQQFSESLTA